MEFNNKVILQYGFVNQVNSQTLIYYPINFQTVCFAIVNSTVNNTTTIGNRTLSNFKIYCSNTTNIDYIAIGT